MGKIIMLTVSFILFVFFVFGVGYIVGKDRGEGKHRERRKKEKEPLRPVRFGRHI